MQEFRYFKKKVHTHTSNTQKLLSLRSDAYRVCARSRKRKQTNQPHQKKNEFNYSTHTLSSSAHSHKHTKSAATDEKNYDS